MYTFDLHDILFFIKSIQNPSDSFDIRNFVDFYQLSTRSSISNKLKHVFSSTNIPSNFYFNRLPKLYNAFPALNLNLSFNTMHQDILKAIIQETFCKQFQFRRSLQSSLHLHLFHLFKDSTYSKLQFLQLNLFKNT